MRINSFTRHDIAASISRVDEILSMNLFHASNSHHPLLRSAFIELLIHLSYLCYNAWKFGSRISFSDDIVTSPKVKDITDAIRAVRDAACHPESDKHFLQKNKSKFTFNIAYGRIRVLSSPEFQLSSDYKDDVCFFFGVHKLYLKRHIIRAFDEAKQKLLPLLQ